MFCNKFLHFGKVQATAKMLDSPGRSTTTLGRSIDRIEMNIESIESKKYKTPLWKDLSQSSQDSFESESDSKESQTFGLILSKVAIFIYAIFEGIKPIVPGFFRIGIRFERILGGSA